jgi:orotidine-5'-phosphate decarboxylase
MSHGEQDIPVGSPASPAGEVRELAELGDLLAELAGLMRDLGALILGLVSAAMRAGDPPARTFTLPPALAELAAAHSALKAEQEALTARLDTAATALERSALRDSLAALTERASRAIGSAVAAVADRMPPQASAPPQSAPPPGSAAPGSAAPEWAAPESAAPEPAPPASAGPESALRESSARATPAREPAPESREENLVQTSAGGSAPRASSESAAARWPETSAADRRLAPVAVALDAPDIEVAAHWATLVTPYVSTVKIGLELYLRYGPTVVATVRGGSGVRVFLDLKLHDIPNTVAGAARAVAKLRPEILTVHAAGGSDMIKAAVEAAPGTMIAAVTLLTSIGDKDLAELGVDGSVSDTVRRLAVLAVGAGARGLVCSPQEVAAVRAEVGPDILLITPGIRAAGATSDDQARIATPEEALKAGADLLVVGRPITRAPDPGAAAAAIAASLRRAVPAP